MRSRIDGDKKRAPPKRGQVSCLVDLDDDRCCERPTSAVGDNMLPLAPPEPPVIYYRHRTVDRACYTHRLLLSDWKGKTGLPPPRQRLRRSSWFLPCGAESMEEGCVATQCCFYKLSARRASRDCPQFGLGGSYSDSSTFVFVLPKWQA